MSGARPGVGLPCAARQSRSSRGAVRLAALATAAVACFASDHAAAQQSLRLQTVYTSDGLASGVTTALYRDRSGMVWIGTPAGLHRYDGHEIAQYVYVPADPTSISGNHVRALLEDRSGTFWVGTAGGGLNRLDRSTGRFERVYWPADGEAPVHDWIESIVEDRSGRLWLGTLGGGLTVWDPETGMASTHRPESGPGSLSHLLVNVVYEDRAGSMWVGTDRGLNRWDPDRSRFDSFVHVPGDALSLSNNRVLSLQEDSAGVLWVGTEAGLVRFEPEARAFRAVASDGRASGLSHPQVTALVAGRPGTMWVGTFGGGLNELDTERSVVRAVHRAGPGSELGDDRIRRMYPGAGTALWVGTWGAGVTRASTRALAFELIAHEPSDPASLGSGDATDVAVDATGGLWVATMFTGVHWRPTGRSGFVHYRHDPRDPATLSGDDAKRLLVASSGHVWVGTLQSGLNRLDPATGRVDRYLPSVDEGGGLAANRVTALLEAPQGTVWIGTSNGLDRLDDPEPPGRFTSVPELANDYVETLLEDPNGTIWVGTAGGGLIALEPSTLAFRRYRHDPEDPLSLSHDHVTHLHASGSGTLWVGTLGGGLNRVERSEPPSDRLRFFAYVERDGLISNTIASVLADDRDRLWVTTRDGLSILDRSPRGVTNFDAANGLPVGEFTTGSVASSSDRLYFGSPAGVVSAPRRQELPEPPAPPVVVTSARALGTEGVVLLGSLREVAEVEYGDVVQFEFAVLDYEGHGEATYAYRLDGLDEEWVELGSTREIAFSNLPPGPYTFSVRGSARHGPWTEATAPVRFAVVPPLWMTLWFRLLFAVVLLALGAGAIALKARAAKDRERALREKEQHFQALLENSHDLVSILDPEGRVHFLGPSVRRILGYSPEKRTGRLTSEIVHPEDRDLLARWMDQIFDPVVGSGVATLRVRAADGDWRVLEAVASSFELPEGRRRAIVNARDVTDRVSAEVRSKELEAALHQRQKLEAIGTLAGGVAHDFNNLLTVIGGHASLLEEEAGDADATRESAAAILRAQESGAALTGQLLAFARKQVVSPGVVDLNELITGLEVLFKRVVGENVTLALALDAKRPWVIGDEGRLEQVLLNLVVNARDAMPGGGQLEIRTENREASGVDESNGTPPDPWVALRVTDTGSGVADDALPHIFEPFYTTKQRGHGTGLGLSTVYGIVTQSGGHVSVETAAGVGSTFTVLLPLAQAPESAESSVRPCEEVRPAGSGTVLVAEDDVEIRSLVRRVLRRQGFDVLEARDGLEALDLLERMRTPPDALLTDLIMPGLNGAELAGRARERWRDLAVVFMTGYDDGTVAREGLDPTSDVLHKPFSPSALSALIHEAVNGQGARPEPLREAREGDPA